MATTATKLAQTYRDAVPRPTLVPDLPDRPQTHRFDPTQGQKIGADPYDDPTQGWRLVAYVYADPTQGWRIGSAPYDDPTRGRS
jgi:hypothetical protein